MEPCSEFSLTDILYKVFNMIKDPCITMELSGRHFRSVRLDV